MTAPRGPTDAVAPTPRWLLLLPFVVILATAALTPQSELYSNQGDVGLYLKKAIAVESGLVPYRDFSFEYPPLALVPMAIPYLAATVISGNEPPSLQTYAWLFAAWEALLILVLGVALLRIVRLSGDSDAGTPEARLRRVAIRLLLVAIGAALALTWRFDLFPAVLATLAVWAALAQRPAIAGVAVGLGILAKLYPLAIVPALLVAWLIPLDLRRLGRYGLALVATVVLILGPFVAVAGSEAFAFLRYQADRGLQIESLGGGLATLIGLLTGSPTAQSYGYSSVQVEGPFAAAWLASLPVMTIVGFGLLGWLGWGRVRREVAAAGRVAPGTVVALASTAVLVLLATSKVFSIQYVAWLVPFAVLLPRGPFRVAAVMIALTMPIHPLLYKGLVAQDALPVLILNLRNALLVGLAGWALLGISRGSGVTTPISVREPAA